MILKKLKALVIDDFNTVNQLIIKNNQSQINLITDLLHHISQSGGKRIRPLLVLLASQTIGYQESLHITLAVVIEFFHTATLLHDDVVDDSTMRRGRQTANKLWDSKSSVLIGDYLVTQSFQLMASVKNWEIIELLADIAHQISYGEIKQLTNRHNSFITIPEYLDIIHSKTALLFAASAVIGPILANSNKIIKDSFYQYGLHIGMAYQLIDDTLDYCSDAQSLGKNIGDDLADGKATMPLLHALKCGTKQQQDLIKISLQQGSLQHLDDILEILYATDAIKYTQHCARKEIELALAALNPIASSIDKQSLHDLAMFILERKN